MRKRVKADFDETKPILEIKKIYHYYGKAKALEEVNLKALIQC